MKPPLQIFAVLALLAGSTHAQWLFEGRVTEADGTAPRTGHVVLRHPSNLRVFRTSRVDSQGRFSVSVDSAGVFLAQFSAVDHRPSQLLLYAVNNARLHVDARLSLNECPDSLGVVGVIGGFNRFDFSNSVPMRKESDGVYRLEIESDSSHFAYQLFGTVMDGRSVNGQQSDSVALDPGGDYVSILSSTHGKANLSFDPRLAVKRTSPACVEVHSTDPESDRIMEVLRLRDVVMSNFRTRRDSVKRAGKSVSLFRDDYDWRAAQWPLTERLTRESDPACRQAMLISLFCTRQMDPSDSMLARQLMAEVSPESPFWSVNPSACIENVRLSLSGRATEQYMAEVVERNPDPEVRAWFLAEALMAARTEGVGKDRARWNFTRLTTEYRESGAAQFARQFLAPSTTIRAGESLPAFAFRDLRDSSRRVTNATLRGKIFLLEFWLTTCAPCVAEMPSLHRAFDRYHPQGFEILSVSIDGRPADLFKFFETRDSMPWTIVLLPTEERTSVMETFELQGVPWPILVDREGRIIAISMDARGEKLEGQLEKAFASSRH